MIKQKKSKKEYDLLIGKRLKEIRIQNASSCRDIAKIINVSTQQYHKYESGTNAIHISMLSEIANKFEAPLVYFYDFTLKINEQDEDYLKFSSYEREYLKVINYKSDRSSYHLVRSYLKIKSSRSKKMVRDLANNLQAGSQSILSQNHSQ